MTGQLLKGLSPSSSHRGGIQSPPPARVWSALDWLLVTQLSPSLFEWSGIVSLTRILLPRTTKRGHHSILTHTHTHIHTCIQRETDSGEQSESSSHIFPKRLTGSCKEITLSPAFQKSTVSFVSVVRVSRLHHSALLSILSVCTSEVKLFVRLSSLQVGQNKLKSAEVVFNVYVIITTNDY